VPEQGFAQNTAAGIAGAQHEDIERTVGHEKGLIKKKFMGRRINLVRL
jgi:hypothetical protein